MTALTGFRLLTPPVLSRSAVLRDEPLRTDVDRQLRGWNAARVVVVDDKGRTPVDWGSAAPPTGPWDSVRNRDAHLRTRPTSGDRPSDDAVLLGEADGVQYWAVRGQADVAAGEGSVEWADLRTPGAALDAL